VQRLVADGTRAGRIAVDPRLLRSSGADGIVIAAANWLQPKNDYGALAQMIEKADLPVVVAGLGAQAIDDRLPELQAGTVRFLKAVSDRCAAISVRGPFTAEVLAKYGIENVQVTGCPSLLWHLRHPARINRMPPAEGPLDISLNATVPGAKVPRKPSKRMDLARIVMQQALREDLDFVLQTETPFLRVFTGEAEDADYTFLDYVFDTEDREAYKDWIGRRLKVFGLVGEWIAYCANRDLVIGTRLHGVIAALLAGTPALLVTHDARTREMAATAGIPHVPQERVFEAGRLDFRRLIGEIDAERFNQNQRAYFDRFRAFWDLNHVPHRLAPAHATPAA
jgi:hypothetical protein